MLLAGSADVAPLVENVDRRRSAFLRTVLARDSSLLNPFFSLGSLGTDGPSCAAELIVAAVVGGNGWLKVEVCWACRSRL